MPLRARSFAVRIFYPMLLELLELLLSFCFLAFSLSRFPLSRFEFWHIISQRGLFLVVLRLAMLSNINRILGGWDGPHRAGVHLGAVLEPFKQIVANIPGFISA